jgi:hypothetical protein
MLQHQRLSTRPMQLHAQWLRGRLHRGREHPLPGVIYGHQGLHSPRLGHGDLHTRQGKRFSCTPYFHTRQGPRLHLPERRHLHQGTLPLHRVNAHRDRAVHLVLSQPQGGAKQAGLLHQGGRVFGTLDFQKCHTAPIRCHLDGVGWDVQGGDSAGVEGRGQGRAQGLDVHHCALLHLSLGALRHQGRGGSLRRPGLEQRVDAVDISLTEGSAIESEQVVHRLPFQGRSGARLWRQAALVPVRVTPNVQQPQPEQHAQEVSNASSASYASQMVGYGKPQRTEHGAHSVSLMWK